MAIMRLSNTHEHRQGGRPKAQHCTGIPTFLLPTIITPVEQVKGQSPQRSHQLPKMNELPQRAPGRWLWALCRDR